MPREPTTMYGVYRSVFEQSLLLNQDTKRPWNFLASLSAELLVVSLVLLLPLLYRDRLPAIHWKDITMAPAPPPAPLPVDRVLPTGSATQGRSLPRPFTYVFEKRSASPQSTFVDIAVDAPPGLAPAGLGGETSRLGTFIPNVVAPPPPKPPVDAPKPPSAPL